MLNLEKGAVLNLNKETNTVLTRLRIGAGWDAAKAGAEIDCDLWLIPKGGAPVFFNNKSIPGAVLDGDDTTGAGSEDGADENIAIDVAALEKDEYTIMINIYNAASKGQFFKDVSRCFIEIEDTVTNKTIFTYSVTEAGGDNSSLVVGKLVKEDGGLVFTALSEFSSKDASTVTKENGGVV